MFTITSRKLLSGALLLGTLCASAAHSQEPPLLQPPGPSLGQPPAVPQQEGVEVQARGPLHEAYAEPIGDAPRINPVVPRQPPEPIEEMPPDQKPDGANVQWIPGYWAWDEERSDFLWISGFWRVPPPDRQWLPGHWTHVDKGWQWVAGFWTMHQQTEVAYLPPPPAPLDAAPSVPAPSPEHIYVAGCWVYRDTRYVWRPGFWCVCRPGWVWVPAHYVWTPCGCVFVEGYWDYALRQRGLLFAPVRIDLRVCLRPRWCYRPCYVVADDCLYGALFVRRGCSCYFFGDYFDAGCRRLGYVSWIDVRIGRAGYDPLFSYYRCQFRNDRHWEVELRGLYVARFNGTVPRPPRTLVQQTTLVQNITINKSGPHVTNIANVTVVAPLTQVNHGVVKLQPVNKERALEEHRAVQQLREASRQRSQVEAQVLAKGAAPLKPTDAPHIARVQLPPAPVVKSSVGLKAPPLPIKPEARPLVKPHPLPVKSDGKPQPGKPHTQP